MFSIVPFFHREFYGDYPVLLKPILDVRGMEERQLAFQFIGHQTINCHIWMDVL